MDSPLCSNAALTDEYLDIIESLDGDIPGRRAANRFMQTSTARYHHEVVPSTFVPRLFDDASWQVLGRFAEDCYSILAKVISHYAESSTYRALFHFDPRMERLMLLPRGYHEPLPFARVDVFLDEDDLSCRLCEFNADGSSGMNEDREVTASIRQSRSYTEFSRRHRIESCELFDSWVRAFVDIYRETAGNSNHPHIAICDYLDLGVTEEFEVYAQHFHDAGYDCSVLDVRALHYDGRHLHGPDGRTIDAIWRRSVGTDVLRFWEESQDLIRAVEHQAVVLIGSFAGHLVHDKQLFDVLMLPQTHELLTPHEIRLLQAAVPTTSFLDASNQRVRRVKAQKDRWVVKPSDSYGAHDVHLGIMYGQEEWEAIVDRCSKRRAIDGTQTSHYLAQAYIEPYRSLTLPADTNIDQLSDAEVCRKPFYYRNLSGLYLYRGKFQGVFSRIGPHPIVCGAHDGLAAATLYVCDGKADTVSAY